jgi:Zn-dependent protease/predicted transcriptional regulator
MLFLSVAFHELAHSLVARRYRVAIVDITLFIFGGVAQMRGEPREPKAEFSIAVAGPLSSLALGLIFFACASVSSHVFWNSLFLYVARLNAVLAAFNLIPGFPMDGGRVVRAYLWKRSKDFLYATRKAADYGQRIALAFIGFGLASLVLGMADGIWLMFIGWFLYSAAQSSSHQASIQSSLMGVTVRDIMVREVVCIPPGATTEEAVNHYFLRYGFGGFPVLRHDGTQGIVTLKEIKNVPREQWKSVTVGEIAAPYEEHYLISADMDAWNGLEMMINEDQGRLLVIEQGRIAGLITRNGIAQYIQIMGK